MNRAWMLLSRTRASADKFPKGEKKKKKKKKKPRGWGGGGGGNEKRPKNSTIKPLSTISVPCMKIQGGHGLPPAANADDR